MGGESLRKRESMHVDRLFMSFNLICNMTSLSKKVIFHPWSLLTGQ